VADRPTPPRPDRPRFRPSTASWVALGGAVAVALAAIAALPPRSYGVGGDAPPLASLALIGTIVAATTSAALYLVVRQDLEIPLRIAAPFAFAFVLIGVVKFVLAPMGLYEVNAVKPLQEVFGSLRDLIGASITAVAVFGLYALGFWIAHRVGTGERSPIYRHRAGRIGAPMIVLGFVGIGLLAVSGLGIVVLIVLSSPAQYLEFVFTSGVGILIVVTLAASAGLIGATFRALGRRPQLVADVGAIVSLFWLGLGFLALYHVLWVVYVLVLGTIWPLKTVVPK
jgi:hypothetical protein